MAIQQVQWGTTQFTLDNEAFRNGFQNARLWYFKDVYGGEDGRVPEEPQRAEHMSSEDLLRLIIVPDAQGVYHFDDMGNENLPEYLGYLIGYLSGPLVPEAPEEKQQRLNDIMALQEV